MMISRGTSLSCLLAIHWSSSHPPSCPILPILVRYPNCDTRPLHARHTPPYHVPMTTHPAPAPDNRIDVDTLRPEERAYVDRLSTALRCGVPGCSCASGNKFHCPAHPNPEIATLTVGFTRGYGYSFHCTRCPLNKILEALAKRGLAPESELFTSAGAQEAGLDPFSLFIPQPPDWLWPNRIPLGQLTLIAGYPSSGKTSIALDIAARVSRGAPAPDQHGAAFPNAPVLLATFNGNPRASVLPILRAFGANLERVYFADLLSQTHHADYYPDDPPTEQDVEAARKQEKDRQFYVWLNSFRRPPNIAELTAPPRTTIPTPFPTLRLGAPWPGLNHTMARLANMITMGSAALVVVDQVEDLAAMHRAQVATVLGMLKALAARSGAAVIALTLNPAPDYPRAVTAMQRRLAQASVVFTTAVVGPGERRFLVPLRPPMSEDAPAIPFVLPAPEDITVAWRKPVFPAHIKALADPTRDYGARTRAAQAFITRALADGPRPAAAIEREAAMQGISRRTLFRARALCDVRSTRIGDSRGPGSGAWQWSLPQRNTLQQDATPDERSNF